MSNSSNQSDGGRRIHPDTPQNGGHREDQTEPGRRNHPDGRESTSSPTAPLAPETTSGPAKPTAAAQGSRGMQRLSLGLTLVCVALVVVVIWQLSQLKTNDSAVTVPAAKVDPNPVPQSDQTPLVKPAASVAPAVQISPAERSLQICAELASADAAAQQQPVSELLNLLPGLSLEQARQVASQVQQLLNSAGSTLSTESQDRLRQIERLLQLLNANAGPAQQSPAQASLAAAAGIWLPTSAGPSPVALLSEGKTLTELVVETLDSASSANGNWQQALLSCRQGLTVCTLIAATGSQTGEVLQSIVARFSKLQQDAETQQQQAMTSASEEARKQSEQQLLQQVAAQNEAVIRQLISDALGDGSQLQQRLEGLKPAEGASAANTAEWQDLNRNLNDLLSQIKEPQQQVPVAELWAQSSKILQQINRISGRIDLLAMERAQTKVEVPQSSLEPLFQLLQEKLLGQLQAAEAAWMNRADKMDAIIKAIKFTLTPEDRQAISDDAASKTRDMIARQLTEIPEIPDLGFVPTDAHTAYFADGCDAMFLRPDPNLTEALKYFTVSAQLRSHDPVYRYFLAMVMKELGRESDAEKQVRAGILLERQLYKFERDRIGERLTMAQGPVRLWLQQARTQFLAAGMLSL